MLARAGMSVESFLWRGKEWITTFLNDLPSIATTMALRRQLFANASRPWTVNDIRDIDLMSRAVPYCDVVVTERHTCAVVRKYGLDGRFGTTMLRSLLELPEALGWSA
jgi:hypothetical protein